MTFLESSSRSIFCLSMIFSEKPVPTFPDHALDQQIADEISGQPDRLPRFMTA